MAGGTGGRLTREGMCVYLELLLYAEQKLTQHRKAIIPQLKNIKLKKEKKHNQRNCPGGLVVENLPCNAGDTGSIPGRGRSHMPWSD